MTQHKIPGNFDSCDVQYHENKFLVLDFGWGKHRIRIDFWEHGLALYYWRSGLWVASPFDPDLNILTPGLSLHSQNPLAGFNRRIPGNLIPVNELFQYHQYSVMRLLRRNGKALHMAQHNPILLALLCEWTLGNDLPDDVLDRMLLLKRERILKRILEWEEKWAVRLLFRLQFTRIDEDSLRLVKRMFENPKVPFYLRRLKSISANILRYSLKDADFLDCRLLQNINHDPKEAKRTLQAVTSMAGDTVKMGRKTYEPDIEVLVKACRSVKQLYCLLDEIQTDYDILLAAGVGALFGSGNFRDPHVSGNKYIVPITKAEELVREGKDMNHCVGTYVEAVFRKEVYIYKVLAPQRATLSIIHSYSYPEIGELFLAGNGAPSQATREAVQAWFEATQVKSVGPDAEKFE